MKNIKIGTLLKLNMSNHIGIIVSVENLFIVRDNNPQIVIVWGDKSRTIETVAGFDNMKRAGCYIVVC
jgi:hypothetical protein